MQKIAMLLASVCSLCRSVVSSLAIVCSLQMLIAFADDGLRSALNVKIESSKTTSARSDLRDCGYSSEHRFAFELTAVPYSFKRVVVSLDLGELVVSKTHEIRISLQSANSVVGLKALQDSCSCTTLTESAREEAPGHKEMLNVTLGLHGFNQEQEVRKAKSFLISRTAKSETFHLEITVEIKASFRSLVTFRRNVITLLRSKAICNEGSFYWNAPISVTETPFTSDLEWRIKSNDGFAIANGVFSVGGIDGNLSICIPEVAFRPRGKLELVISGAINGKHFDVCKSSVVCEDDLAVRIVPEVLSKSSDGTFEFMVILPRKSRVRLGESNIRVWLDNTPLESPPVVSFPRERIAKIKCTSEKSQNEVHDLIVQILDPGEGGVVTQEMMTKLYSNGR